MELSKLRAISLQSKSMRLPALIFISTLSAVAISSTSSFAAISPTPTPSPVVTQPVNTPVASDTVLPKIQQLIATASRSGSQFTISLGLNIQVHLNAVRGITIKFAPRYSAGTLVDPSLCTLPSNVSSMGSGPASAPSLQSRTIVGTNYLEVHTIVSTTTLSLGQDICAGDYLLTSIALVDIAGHDLTITANQASTTNTSVKASSSTDVPVEQSTLWQKFPTLAPCPQLSNVAPVVSTQNKNTVPTVNTQTLTRATCDQSINFPTPLFSVQSAGLSTASVPPAPNPNNISGKDGNLPLIDYAGQIKTNQDLIQALTAKNSQLLLQIKSLQSQLKKTSPGSSGPTAKAGTKAPTPRATGNSSQPRSGGVGNQPTRTWSGSSGNSKGGQQTAHSPSWAIPSPGASNKK